MHIAASINLQPLPFSTPPHFPRRPDSRAGRGAIRGARERFVPFGLCLTGGIAMCSQPTKDCLSVEKASTGNSEHGFGIFQRKTGETEGNYAFLVPGAEEARCGIDPGNREAERWVRNEIRNLHEVRSPFEPPSTYSRWRGDGRWVIQIHKNGGREDHFNYVKNCPFA